MEDKSRKIDKKNRIAWFDIMGCCLLNTKIFNLNVEIIILVISFQETEIKSYFNHPGGDVAIENEGKKIQFERK